MISMTSLVRKAVSASLLLAVSGATFAWPDRPIRIVVGFAPGGVADIAARAVAENLQRKLGQPVTVENKAGAGGRMATDAVAKADADGHTLGLLVGGDAVIAASETKLPYNLSRDLHYVTTLSVYPFVIAVPASSPHTGLGPIIEVARKSPGSIRFATAGPGTTQHLIGELMASMTDVDMTPVHYRGSSAALTDVLAGRVDFTIASYTAVRTQVEAGKLKLLAITSKQRSAALPDVPAVAESLNGFEVMTWMGVVAPAKTPPAVVEQLARELKDVMNLPAVRERFMGNGLDPATSTSAEFKSRVDADVARWRSVIQARKLDLTQ